MPGPTYEARRERNWIRVELPCGTCVHQGVCLIEEQLEQDLVLRIGIEDARSKLVEGGPSQPVELRIDCSWYDDRPIKPKGSGKLKRRYTWAPGEREKAAERMRQRRAWEKAPTWTRTRKSAA